MLDHERSLSTSLILKKGNGNNLFGSVEVFILTEPSKANSYQEKEPEGNGRI